MRRRKIWNCASEEKTIRVSLIDTEEKFEDYYGKFSDKKRKLYNGMIKCNLFQYFPNK